MSGLELCCLLPWEALAGGMEGGGDGLGSPLASALAVSTDLTFSAGVACCGACCALPMICCFVFASSALICRPLLLRSVALESSSCTFHVSPLLLGIVIWWDVSGAVRLVGLVRLGNLFRNSLSSKKYTASSP